jgi:F-type H+-transporting ATPase subunit epsilon
MADMTLPFKLITPTGVVFDGQVQEVTAVNPIGEFGVLPQHINYLTALVPCAITVKLEDGSYRLFVVSGGLAEVKDGEMTVLAPVAEAAEDLKELRGLSEKVVAAEEELKNISFYEVKYDNAVREVQLAKARERAAQASGNSR